MVAKKHKIEKSQAAKVSSRHQKHHRLTNNQFVDRVLEEEVTNAIASLAHASFITNNVSQHLQQKDSKEREKVVKILHVLDEAASELSLSMYPYFSSKV